MKETEQELIDAEAEKQVIRDELHAIRGALSDINVSLGELCDSLNNLREKVIRLELSIEG